MADTETPPVTTSMAGRNLPAAIVVSLLLGGMVNGTLVFAPSGWVVILSVAMAIAAREFSTLCRPGRLSVTGSGAWPGRCTVKCVCRPSWWMSVARKSLSAPMP